MIILSNFKSSTLTTAHQSDNGDCMGLRFPLASVKISASFVPVPPQSGDMERLSYRQFTLRRGAMRFRLASSPERFR